MVPPSLTLATWACVVVWLLAGLAHPDALLALFAAVLPILIVPIIVIAVGMAFPLTRGLVRGMTKAVGVLLGAILLGGYGIARSVQASRTGDRADPSDLLIEISERDTGERYMVRFVRARADIAIATGTTLSADGWIQGTTLVAERITLTTGLGTVESTSAGSGARAWAYALAGFAALLALSSVMSLVR